MNVYLVLVAQLCLTLCDPMNCSLPGSSAHGILQNTGVGSCSLLQRSSQPGDWTQISHIAGGFITIWATREARFQTILEWVVISFSRGSFWPKDWTCISCIGRQIIYHWTSWEVGQLHMLSLFVNNSGWTSTVDWVGTDACGFIWENKGFEETENVHDVLWAL